jgi:hypothetical protein
VNILKSMVVVLATALAAGFLAGPVLRPAFVGAEGEEEAAVAAKVLVVDGVTLSLELDEATCAAGKKPALTLCAVNGADAVRKVTVEVVVAVGSEFDGGGGTDFDVEIARVAFVPDPEWKRRVPVELTPGGTRRVRIEAGQPLEAGSIVTFHIRSTEEEPRDLLAATLTIPLETTEAKAGSR